MYRFRRYGFLLRSYAKTEAEVSEVADKAAHAVSHILEKFPETHHIAVHVAKDKDCGKTAAAIRAALYKLGHPRIVGNLGDIVSVHTISGKPEREVLNAGVTFLEDIENCTHTVIVSNKAVDNLDQPLMEAVDEAFALGAKVVGVSLDELRDIVLAGRVQNTLAVWENRALKQVGYFTSEIGVEETSVSIELVRQFGCCIAILDRPAGTLKLRSGPEAQAEHSKIIATKTERQQQEAARVNGNLEMLRDCIMEGYPKPV